MGTTDQFPCLQHIELVDAAAADLCQAALAVG